jgi:hypothetical protein
VKRALIFIVAAVTLVATVGFFSAGRACAHDPRFACSPRGQDRPIHITQPEKSWAFYGHLSAAEVDHYTVDTLRSIVVPVQILIDERDAGNPARPVAKIKDAAGRSIGAIDLASGHPFFEPFSRVRYLESPDRLIRFSAGTSTITVSMRDGSASQRYVLGIGSAERFSASEIPYLRGSLNEP